MVRLGSFAFDSESLTLVRDGAVVRAQRKTMELLAALVAAREAVVSCASLRETLWHGGAVEDRNLTQHVYLLRGVLASDPRVRVETIARRGYRLVAPSPVPAFAPRRSALLATVGGRFARSLAVAACSLALAATAGCAAHRQAQPLSPQLERVLQLGWLQWERRSVPNLDVAERYFRSVRRAAPRDARGYAGLAAVAVIRGNLREGKAADPSYVAAAKFARQALALDAHNPDAFDVLGLVAMLQAKDYVEGDALLRHAQALDPHNAYAHVWRGIALFHDGRLDDAVAEFEHGELLAPGSKTAARWLGYAQYNRHAFAAASEQFHTVLELDPSDMETILGLAQVDEAQGNYGRAIARLKRSGGLIPQPKRMTALARLDALSGRRALALRELAALPRAPHVDAAELAATQLALGNRAAAIATLAHEPAAERVETSRALEWDSRYAALRRIAQSAKIN